MTPSPACTAVVAAFEGLGDGDQRTPGLQAYFDQNRVATAGYGHVLLNTAGVAIRAAYDGDPSAVAAATASMKREFGSASITPAQATQQLALDLAARSLELAPVLHDIPTSQAQYDAMMSLAFNIGVHAFSLSTLLVRHKAGVTVSRTLDFALIEQTIQVGGMPPGIEGGFASWCHAAGAFDLGLFRRRMAEVMVYRGDDPTAAIKMAWAIK